MIIEVFCTRSTCSRAILRLPTNYLAILNLETEIRGGKCFFRELEPFCRVKHPQNEFWWIFVTIDFFPCVKSTVEILVVLPTNYLTILETRNIAKLSFQFEEDSSTPFRRSMVSSALKSLFPPHVVDSQGPIGSGRPPRSPSGGAFVL